MFLNDFQSLSVMNFSIILCAYRLFSHPLELIFSFALSLNFWAFAIYRKFKFTFVSHVDFGYKKMTNCFRMRGSYCKQIFCVTVFRFSSRIIFDF